MRLPDGYGGVSRLPGNRRKPWRVRVTDHWQIQPGGTRKQIYRTIGYYETREEALDALSEYHKNPHIKLQTLTFAEIYNRWSSEHFPTLGESTIRSHTTSYDICAPLHGLRFSDLRLEQLQGVIESSGKNLPVLIKVKSTLTQMYEYASKHDIVTKNYAEFIDLDRYEDPEHEEKHKIFTSEEIKKLWSISDQSPDIRQILILICSGLRIGELLALKKTDVHLNERIFMIRKSKTSSGIRVVPIAEAVLPFWEELMATDSPYVIPNLRFKSDPMSYSPYLRFHYKQTLKQFGFAPHFPHDTRYTFISILTSARVMPVVIKRIVGHKSNDVTERVYTQFEIQQLVSTIDVPNYREPYIVEKLVL